MRKVSKKRITEEQMRHYFMGRSNPLIPILIISGSISFVFYLSLRIFFHINEPRFILGGILLIIGNFLRERSTEITDKDYDEWLKQQRQTITQAAPQKVYLDVSQLIRRPLSLHGVIDPDTDAAKSYAKGVYKKTGKDNKARYSVNIFTLFFPAEHHIAILSCEVDALDQQKHIERASHYFYKDIVGLRTEEIRLSDHTEHIILQLQSFSLKVANGDSIDTGAVLNVTVLDLEDEQQTVKTAYIDTDVNGTISTLLMLLRQKKWDSPQ